MPDNQNLEYNPVVSGFHHADGPMNIPLNEAKNRFGMFPSQFGYLTKTKRNNQKRNESKVLNLKLGYFIKELLGPKKKNLKKDVYKFYAAWHRDYKTEFEVNMPAFYNLNDAVELKKNIRANWNVLQRISQIDIRKEIERSGLIKKSTLYSIKPTDVLIPKLSEILLKRMVSATGERVTKIKEILNLLQAHALVEQANHLAGAPLISLEKDMIECFADEISSLLMKLNTFIPLEDVKSLKGRTGVGVEFEYATRDNSYLELGKVTGDCTADKRYDQSNADIENIFWTVFSWILDRNYQILKVYYNNEFVMKVHLLPLFVSVPQCPGDSDYIAQNRSDFMILAVDAIETTLAFSGKLKAREKDPLVECRDEIFSKTMAFITDLADRLHIRDVYAEKFSNTAWVRDKLCAYPEIFFNVDHLIKIDELEDVYYLVKELSAQYGYDIPQAVFMEIQMKNTSLLPGYINKSPGLKSFSLIRGRTEDGINMKRVIGI
ncbi:hypothetical protein [uncultured Desulfobacter sp.]|uniref:hypothetical protein n=1 Tax=uncultured Desulfobacter sp. TaxID=240139 RepID=UPI002AABA0E1|nr:hypothetical protein [uncultured Desulfobacter sp.]